MFCFVLLFWARLPYAKQEFVQIVLCFLPFFPPLFCFLFAPFLYCIAPQEARKIVPRHSKEPRPPEITPGGSRNNPRGPKSPTRLLQDVSSFSRAILLLFLLEPSMAVMPSMASIPFMSWVHWRFQAPKPKSLRARSTSVPTILPPEYVSEVVSEASMQKSSGTCQCFRSPSGCYLEHLEHGKKQSPT